MKFKRKFLKKSQLDFEFIYTATRNRPEIVSNLGLIEKTKPIFLQTQDNRHTT